MSLFKAPRHLSYLSFAALFMVIVILAACGFRPVHQFKNDQSIQQDLWSINVSPIAGRDGLVLRNRLLEKFSPRGNTDAPEYQLSVQLTKTTEALLIQLDNTATRINLKMNAVFVLLNLTTEATVYKGSAYSVGSYNVVESEFATVAAEKNTADRVAQAVGEEIFDLLVIYFNGASS
ncbi:MAG: hypothetical protein HOM52_07215 [Rhodospirillaceae bacterium]|jgi:LPS-assembly lipoprotein|nr:hypothetical protein [Rhodospirillaceae bacterium]MBT3926079.1 hypothetical protein [Rhodospirillaceae bacterium]MBT4426309.1 hypothetical protein [Rhodospirillaceae bacterium]MBT5038284.1 hypothetical protein [Rhodospirillaceae bacterium]MBT5778835.1 hypothetical protein [Rhodospirillaceae bacterium]